MTKSSASSWPRSQTRDTCSWLLWQWQLEEYPAALEKARRLGMKSYAIVGYAGGKAKDLADVPIHFAIDDMQIAEDTQTIICHMIMQWLHATQRDQFVSQGSGAPA